MAHLVPGTRFLGLYSRCLTRQAALHNLEQAMGVIWKAGQVRWRW